MTSVAASSTCFVEFDTRIRQNLSTTLAPDRPVDQDGQLTGASCVINNAVMATKNFCA